MISPLKIGLMGYGFAGQTFHAPVIAHSGAATLAVIATSQAEHAQADYPDAAIVPDLDALLSLAAGDGYDLLVMGAYGHARWKERVLGGTTRTIFESATLPVLMSH
jgi:nucleotide-binding universal stress UspA family protein